MTTFKEYRNEINKIFSRYIRGGFVDYYHCRGLSRDMIDLMIDATKELSSRGEYKELFDLANKGFLKWGKTNKDDSGGETQDFVYYVEQAWGAVHDSGGERVLHETPETLATICLSAVQSYPQDAKSLYRGANRGRLRVLRVRGHLLRERTDGISSLPSW